MQVEQLLAAEAAPSEHAEASSYRAAGFSNRIGWGTRPALLLIDVCKAYFTPGSPLDVTSNPAAANSIDVMKSLLAAAREAKVHSTSHWLPIIWTQVQYTRPDMSDAGLFYKKAPVISVFSATSTRGLNENIPGLEPLDGEDIILKKHPSAFFGTELASLLQFAGVDTLVICGVSTSGCVRATALDAMCWNFRAMVVGTACGDRSSAIHEANLFDMDAKMADVVTEGEAVERLRAATGWRALSRGSSLGV
ncbi:hypothetical protein DOTSEDRAFT_121005 [Dothistroma septosporum NZE10]|uniref:Isochorismatase-like domain-containing protein n=1 Tax=Dothistroma septosporum (strain NZE10 / CBS 128990) TaxID=675120 RepID=N1Q3I7_DOTSN|nr:hypothetical protein DOTSEDRAFT_121005 [Dothistroma septosporum NZE10]